MGDASKTNATPGPAPAAKEPPAKTPPAPPRQELQEQKAETSELPKARSVPKETPPEQLCVAKPAQKQTERADPEEAFGPEIPPTTREKMLQIMRNAQRDPEADGWASDAD